MNQKNPIVQIIQPLFSHADQDKKFHLDLGQGLKKMQQFMNSMPTTWGKCIIDPREEDVVHPDIEMKFIMAANPEALDTGGMGYHGV
jgi:hypothetical protein